MDPKKRTVIDLNTKIKVIEASEKDNMTVKQIVQQFNIGKTQVYDILKRKLELKTKVLYCNGSSKTNARKTRNEEINKLVYEWYVSAKTKLLPISGPILQHQAREIAQRLGKTDFSASNGWLDSFRKRHQISFKEGDNVNTDNMVETKVNIVQTDFIQDYVHVKIENEDEDDDYCQEGASRLEETCSNKTYSDEDENDNCCLEEANRLEGTCSIKTYSDALTPINELQEFSIQKGDAELFNIICRAKILTEIRAAATNSYKQETPLDPYKK